MICNKRLTIFEQPFYCSQKVEIAYNTVKTNVKQAFLTFKNKLKNSSFEASKTVLFETVFESKKSLFYDGLYSVLSDFDFLSSLKSS